MIPRRAAVHVKAHNWFALAIDLAVVIVGVFVGMQVNNWNEARGERAAEQRYLDRLLADTKANVAELERLVAVYQRRGRILSDLALALQGAGVPPSDDALQDALCRWFAAPVPALRQATYVELVSSGALSILRDDELRILLAEYSAAEEQSAYLATLMPAVQRAAAPLDEYRSWAVAVSPDETTVTGVRCNFDTDGMRRDPRMPSVVAQLFRDQKNYESFRGAELEKARAVESRLKTLMRIDARAAGKETKP